MNHMMLQKCAQVTITSQVEASYITKCRSQIWLKCGLRKQVYLGVVDGSLATKLDMHKHGCLVQLHTKFQDNQAQDGRDITSPRLLVRPLHPQVGH